MPGYSIMAPDAMRVSSQLEKIAAPGIINAISIIFVIGAPIHVRTNLCTDLAETDGIKHINANSYTADSTTHKIKDLIDNTIVPAFLKGEKIFLLEEFPGDLASAEAFEKMFTKPKLAIVVSKGEPWEAETVKHWRAEGLLEVVTPETSLGEVKELVLKATGNDYES